MSLSDVGMAELAEANNAGRDDMGADNLFVTFRMHPVLDEVATAAAGGRPVYVETEFIKIIVPGDKHNTVDRPVREKDKRLHRNRYEAFKAGQQSVVDGTPLREWTGCTRSEAEMLAYYKVLSVDHLAELSDGAISEIGPIRHLVEKAKRHIEAAKNAAPAEKLAAELKAKDAEMESLRRQMKELTERVEKQQAGRK